MNEPKSTKPESINVAGQLDLTRLNKQLQLEIDERKRAEETLRLHAAMMDNVTEGIYLIGLDDLIIKWTNEKFEKMFGYDTGEMVGKQVDIVNAPTGMTPTETWISVVNVLKETGKWHGEVKNIKRDGNNFWCYANVSLFDHPEYGTVIVSVHTDITERKQSVEALRQSEEDLRLRIQINNIFLTYPDEDMYAEILKLILKDMESKYGTFGYFDENGSFVAPAVTRKIYWDKCNVPEKNIIFQKGTFGGIWGRAIKEKKTLISNDGPFQIPKGHITIENTMVTPIIFREEVISAIHIANKPNGYNEQDRMLLETIADQIAPVLYARVQRDKKDVQRKQAENERKKLHYDLNERYKELNLLYETTKLAAKTNITIEEVLQHIILLIPPAWQYPKITCARITLNEQKYSTVNFAETEWKQSAPIRIYGKNVGLLEVYYLKEMPQIDEGPFLKEERNLINTMAKHLGTIIEHKQTEETLRKNEHMLNETQHLTKVGGWEYDVEKKTLIWTDEVYRIYGVTPEDYDTNNITQDIQFYSPQDRGTIERAFKSAVEEGKSYDLQLRFTNAQGEQLWVRTVGHAEVNDDRVVRVYGNIMDITSSKQAEEKINKLNEELEQRIKERTADLEKKNKDLEIMNKGFVMREHRVIELKKRIDELEKNAKGEE